MQPNQFNQPAQPGAGPYPTGQSNDPTQPGGYPAGTAPMGGQQPMMQTPQQQQQEEVNVRNPNSAQNSLLLTELRDGLAVMNDGSFRAVVACKSINFDLMSDREREGIEYSYQSFLNSLYFPVQIYIRSQRVDIGPYLQRLDDRRRAQDNMLLGVLMDDYINFIGAIAEETNIMDKSFYIAIPYYITGDINSAVSSSKNLLTNLFAPQKQMKIRVDESTYSKAKEELGNRVNTVINGLFQVGVRSVQLNTKELGELYYNAYNPDTAVREPLGDFDNLTATVIEKAPTVDPNAGYYQPGGQA